MPSGASPPAWARHGAQALGLDDVGRRGLTAVAWGVTLVVVVAFTGVLAEAWARRIRLTAVLVASGLSLVVAVAAPLLLSRDVYTYAAYGRIETLYDHNPYLSTLASFRHDPFVAVTSVQWLHTHSHYGPVFTLLSAAIVAAVSSVGGTIFVFKLVAGLAIALATAFVALTAARIRPDRAALAVALIGLNPVIVVHTVGGGHIDALIAAPLAAAAAIAVTRPRPTSLRAVAITVLLTLTCLLKAVLFPVLALWLWWIRGRRSLGAHVIVVVGLALASLAPFLAGWHTFAPFTTLGGVEAWASPSHLVGRAAQALFGTADALRAVEAAFMLLFLALLRRLARRPSAVETWGVAVLLLALSLPFLLPWYAAWFAPFLAFLDDTLVTFAGAFTTIVLALTLIPADPFHGVTTPAVMDGVHYGAASVLLVTLAVVAWRVLGGRRVEPVIALDSRAGGV